MQAVKGVRHIGEGYIKLHRQINDHWIWQRKPFSPGQAWIDILLMVNHDTAKFPFGNEIIEVERGECITSETKLASKWGWSRHKVRDFLSLLESDSMLVKKSDTKRTSLKVLNYNVWQDSSTAEGQQKDSKRTGEGQVGDTNKNDKNDKNDKNEKNIYIVIFDYWNSKKIIVHKKLTDKIKRKISGALDTHSPDELKKAIDNYHTVLTGDKYYWTYKWTLEDFLQRGLEKFLTDACFENYKKDKGTSQQFNKAPNKGNFDQRKYDNDHFDKFYKEV